MPENNKFKIIHEETADKLYNLINNSVKEKLDNVSWLLVRLKAEQNIVCPPGTDLEECTYNLIYIAYQHLHLFSCNIKISKHRSGKSANTRTQFVQTAVTHYTNTLYNS